MDEQVIDYSDEIVHIIKSITKQFRSKFMKEAIACGFTAPQLMLLHELYNYPNISLKELSDKLYLSKSTVSGIVDRLEKAGYVIREIPEENRRMVKLSLSKKCPDKDKLFNIQIEHTRKVVEKLGVEQTLQVIDALRKLRDAIMD
jgi:MarR family transcriptional regulator, organic hydroperoxide resistance regulator